MSSHDLLPLSDVLQVHSTNGSEGYSAPLNQTHKRSYTDDIEADTKRARVGYNSMHMVDSDSKRQEIAHEARPNTSKPASSTGGGAGSGTATIKSFDGVPADKMKRKELLFKDITKLPVLNAPSLWYGNERVKTRGVFHQPSGRFKASLRVNGKDIYLGQYACEELACQAYDRFAIKVHGVDGDHRLNFGIVWYKEDIPFIEKTSLEQLVQEIREDAKILNKRAITLRKSQKNNRSVQSPELNINTLLQQNFLMEQMQRSGRQEKLGQQALGLHGGREEIGIPSMPMVSGVPVLHYPVNQSVLPQEQIQHNAYNTILANALLQNPNPMSQGIGPYSHHQMQQTPMSRLPTVGAPNNNNLLLQMGQQQMMHGSYADHMMHQLNQPPANVPGHQGLQDPRYR